MSESLYPARLHVNTTKSQKEKIIEIAQSRAVNYSVVVRDAIDYYLNHCSEKGDNQCR